MDKLILLQTDCKGSISRAFTNYKKSPKERLTRAYLETRLESLETLWKDFITTHKSVVKGATSQDITYFTEDFYGATEECFFEYKSEIKTALEYLAKSSSIPNVTVGNSNNCNINLPKITIQMFSGDYAQWTSFKDLFTSLIHNNDLLDKVQKLHYLKGHLSGEAEQLLRHIPLEEANYDECWTLLNERYNNKRFLANCWLKRLINQSSLNIESANGIKILLDTTIDSLNGLRNLGIDVSSWDVMIIYIISSKLDSESRKQWEFSISNSLSELPNLKEFKDFLEGRFRALECLEPNPIRRTPPFIKPRVLHATDQASVASNVYCQFCEGTHKIINCKQFAKKSPDSRYSFVQTSGLCFNCLGPHAVKYCRQYSTCQICHRRHHSLLHSQPKVSNNQFTSNTDMTNIGEASNAPEMPVIDDAPAKISTLFSQENKTSQVLLATAVVKADSAHGNTQLIRVLLDQGSQSSFISESTVQSLGLKKIPTRSDISGLGGTQSASSKHMVLLTIHSIHDPTFSFQVRAHVLRKITSLLPSQQISQHNWIELKDITLADPDFHTPNKIDVLLGAEVYAQVIRKGLIKGPPGVPVAQNTALGWILSGQTVCQGQATVCHHVTVNMHAHISDNELLKQFWELEADNSCLTKRMLTQEEEQCEEFYTKTTQRDDLGRYVVRLPFRNDDPQCKYGNSRDVAIKRLLALERKFARNPELKARYSEVIHEYIDLGHMVPIDNENDPVRHVSVYLPHHAVIREDRSTTKVRVVFDASCKYSNGVSLNDSLLVGPTLQPELRHIIMRWRCYPICLVADIIKMYRQVKVAEEDSHYQRILWRNDSNSEIKDYRLMRVTFGTASAPYLAVKSLQQLTLDEGQHYPLASERVKTDYYVDDLMTGCETIEEGVNLFKEMTKLLAKGGFELQKWVTNDDVFAEKIEETNKVEQKEVILKTDEVLKILGLTWDRTHDAFNYFVQLSTLEAPVTKRKVISDIARLFDPLGWAAPVIVTAKVFIQSIWLSGIDWDEKLPEKLLSEWKTYRERLLQVSEIRLPRWVNTRSSDSCVEIHGFCDASTVAYAAVVYLKVVDSANIIRTSLVTARSKVAPVKQVSVPRLELCGAVLLAKLMQEVGEVLRVPKSHWHAWTVSTVVLAWLSSHPSQWKTFVGNRVSEILSIIDNNQWAHVQTSHNPADIASRGITPIQLATSLLWREGPTWLKNTEVIYTKLRSNHTELEKRIIKTHLTVKSKEFESTIWERYSSLQKLIRVIAYCKRFLNVIKVKQANKKFESYLTSEEIGEALDVCIKHHQKTEFENDQIELSKTGNVKNKSILRILNPFIDQNGIIRVGGRIQHSSLDYNVKHPIVVSKKGHLTKLLLNDAHIKTLHGGPTLMLNFLRSRYWIISAKKLVKHFVRKCTKCIRYAASSKHQLMGSLPSARVTANRPFLNSGVDFAGPINVRMSKGRGNKSYKGYICLFVCMSTKAIHLEIISDLTSQGFIAGFKRFVARRGHCSHIWSDNGTNFVGASLELYNMVVAEQSSTALEIKTWLSNNGVTWHFIPPHAPNFGGLWEAGVKSTKFHLKRVIGESTLAYEELSTVTTQIEACLNSRPISQISENPENSIPLTPGHFLIGEALITVPDASYEQSNISSLRRWQLTQKMVQDFWRRWSHEYVVNLMQRYKWSYQNTEPELGDIVLIKEDGLPPARWLLGKIIEKHPGLDGLTRVVTLKCKNSLIKRATAKLCVLPVAD